MVKRYSVRRFSLSDVSNAVKLLNVVFKNKYPFTDEWWIWKYQNNPAGFWGERGDIWVAEDEGKIVGFYALMPVRVKIGNKSIITGQSVDTAVHPEYRRMGIFSTLAKKVYADCKDRYSFLFGYPSEMAYKGFLSLGWKDYPINELVKFINYERPLTSFVSHNLYVGAAKVLLKAWQTSKRIATISSSHRKLEGEDVIMERIDRFEGEFDTFWKTERKENIVIIERTVSYLNWRFSKVFGHYQIWVGRAVRDGHVMGYLVLRITQIRNIKNVLDIVDLCSLPKQEKFLKAVIDLSCRIGKEMGADLIHVRVPNWHDYAKIFSSKGYVGIGGLLNRVSVYAPRIIFYNFGRKDVIPKMHEFFYSLADTDYA